MSDRKLALHLKQLDSALQKELDKHPLKDHGYIIVPYDVPMKVSFDPVGLKIHTEIRDRHQDIRGHLIRRYMDEKIRKLHSEWEALAVTLVHKTDEEIRKIIFHDVGAATFEIEMIENAIQNMKYNVVMEKIQEIKSM